VFKFYDRVVSENYCSFVFVIGTDPLGGTDFIHEQRYEAILDVASVIAKKRTNITGYGRRKDRAFKNHRE
jgi:hypothetical protein